jgi:hypothetical protein
MNSFVPDWEYGTGTTWNANYTKVRHFALTGEGMIPAVSNFPYSIGYTTLGTVLEQGPVPYARIINRAGNIVGAESNYIVQALESVRVQESPIQFVDRADGWPIISVSYQAIYRTTSDCERRRTLFKFFHWVKISATALERLDYLGGSTLGTFLEDKAANFLSTYTCDNVKVLEYRIIKQHSSRAFDALLVIAFVLLSNAKNVSDTNFLKLLRYFWAQFGTI